jgi:hypothetical protein
MCYIVFNKSIITRNLPNTSETDEKEDDDFLRLDFFPWGVVCIFCFDINEVGEDFAGVIFIHLRKNVLYSVQ